MARTKNKKKGALEFRMKAKVGTHRMKDGTKVKSGESVFVDDPSELAGALDKFELVDGSVKKKDDVDVPEEFSRQHKGDGEYFITLKGSSEPLHEGYLSKEDAMMIVEGGREEFDKFFASEESEEDASDVDDENSEGSDSEDSEEESEESEDESNADETSDED
jgi:hypothetical protein